MSNRNNSPIPQSSNEIIEGRREFTDLVSRVSVVETNVTWIKRNLEHKDGFGRSVLLLLIATMPGIISLALIGFLYVKGVFN